MKNLSKICFFSITLTALLIPTLTNAENIHGDYKDWRLLSISHRTDKHTLRAILGNDQAIDDARASKKTWTDGAILTKVKWKESTHPNWAQAIVPGEFEVAEVMIKDSKKYPTTGGWGFARWENNKLVNFDEIKSKECFACHTVMQNNDYVFTFSALK